MGVNSLASPEAAGLEDLRKAVGRRDIRFPVAHDPGREFSRRYNVHAWPAHVLIDPEGKVVLQQPGEDATSLGPTIARVVRTFDARSQIDRRPLPFGTNCPKTK